MNNAPLGHAPLGDAPLAMGAMKVLKVVDKAAESVKLKIDPGMSEEDTNMLKMRVLSLIVAGLLLAVVGCLILSARCIVRARQGYARPQGTDDEDGLRMDEEESLQGSSSSSRALRTTKCVTKNVMVGWDTPTTPGAVQISEKVSQMIEARLDEQAKQRPPSLTNAPVDPEVGILPWGRIPCADDPDDLPSKAVRAASTSVDPLGCQALGGDPAEAGGEGRADTTEGEADAASGGNSVGVGDAAGTGGAEAVGIPSSADKLAADSLAASLAAAIPEGAEV